jgi:hypothetical protein
MGFGFLVEKLDLFLELAAPSLPGRTLSLPGQKFGNIAGVVFIVLGTAMVGIAAARFLMTAKNIDRDLRPGTGSRIDIAFAGLLVLLGCDARPCNEALTDVRKRTRRVRASIGRGHLVRNLISSSRKTDIRLGKNMEDTQKHYTGGEIKEARQSLRWA